MKKYEYSLLEICENLHMNTTGGMESNPTELVAWYDEIKFRVSNWDDGNISIIYDSLVFLLCKTTLSDFEKSHDIKRIKDYLEQQAEDNETRFM